MSNKLHCDVEGCTETASTSGRHRHLIARDLMLPKGWYEVSMVVMRDPAQRFGLKPAQKEVMLEAARKAGINIPRALMPDQPNDPHAFPGFPTVVKYHVCDKHPPLKFKADAGVDDNEFDDIHLQGQQVQALV